VEVDALLDQGADISIISKPWVIRHIRKPHFYKLDTNVRCYAYDKNPTSSSASKRVDKDAVTICEVLYEELYLLGYKFHFPIYCHPANIPLLILGNDYLSMVDLSVNVATATIKVPQFAIFETEEENRLELSKQGSEAAGAYLIANLALLTAGRAENPYTKAGISRNINGIELNFNEFFLYPDKAVNVFAAQHVHLPCHTTGILFRMGTCYAVRAVTRGAFGDLQVLSRVWLQEGEDSELVTLPVSTETALSLTTMYPCAVAHPIREAYVKSLSSSPSP